MIHSEISNYYEIQEERNKKVFSDLIRMQEYIFLNEKNNRASHASASKDIVVLSQKLRSLNEEIDDMKYSISLLKISQKKQESEPNVYELVITSIIILSIFVCIAMFHPLLQSTN
jgi:hypothetical protein